MFSCSMPFTSSSLIDATSKNGPYYSQPDIMSGSPMGVYGKLPDKLDPIKIEHGKAAQLILTFDDSTKAP
jgi:hypothetical protein